ncbi:MAG: diacylglycerol kinase family protein [Candidatus Levybacteria bacterium]|nr:diacylglycerol kinase family protein [Candidatus Levybacteria bacterium]
MLNHRSILQSFGYAFEGIFHALKDNQNLRIHFATGIIVIIASLILHVNPFEMGILGIMILLVISAEMVNSSIEEMVNLISVEHSKEAKTAKDVAAGTVMLTAISSVMVGFLIFFPYVVRLFR